MELLKDERTTRFDVFTSLAEETLEFYEGLVDAIEDAAFRALFMERVARQRRLIAEIQTSRRARGELPQRGDPERAYMHALYEQTLGLAGGGDRRVLTAIVEAASETDAAAEDVLACGPPPDQVRLIDAFRSSCEGLIRSVRARIGEDLARPARIRHDCKQ